MTKSGELSSTRQLQLDWWTVFRDALLTSKVVASGQTPRPQYWYDVALGRSGMFLSNSANANDGRIGVRVYLSERQGGNHALEQLLKDRASIEEEIGHQLQWNPNPENRDKTIAVYRDADLNNRAGWRNRLVGLPAVDERIALVDFEPGHERSELAAGPARSPELRPCLQHLTYTTLRALSASFLTGPWGCTGGGRVFDDTAELNRPAAAAARHVVWLGRVK